MNELETSEASRGRSEAEDVGKSRGSEQVSKPSQSGKSEIGPSNLDGHSPAGKSERERKSADMQPRRPSMQKEERKTSKEDSDYVRDSTETTSSGGSSSASGYVAGKVRRVPRAVRNKKIETCVLGTEVRRNPVRVKKKAIDKDFTRPRQRLLTAKRKAALGEVECGKRGKLSTMPYMNTRSVTRKMYNVGATYQAPTKKDETEWKEWPVHGMHERPVFHPQMGLASEYLGRYFTSADGCSYREIVGHPEIEVVSVDPRSSSVEKKRTRKPRLAKGAVSSTKTSKSITSEETTSFVSCMHNSLHCVVGYCSQVVSPSCNANLHANDSKSVEIIDQSETELKSLNVPDGNKSEKDSKKSKDAYALPPTKTSNGQTLKPLPRLFPMQTMYVTNSQKSISFTNVKTLQASGIKVQEVLRPSPKNPLILVNTSEAKSSSTMRGRILKPVPNNLSLVKLDSNSLNEDSLLELSPIYKSTSSEGSSSLSDASKQSSKDTPVKSSDKIEPAASKGRYARERKEKQSAEDYDSGVRSYGSPSMSNKTWPTSDASEIAKILSDYNKSASKTSESPNYTYPGSYVEDFEYPKTSTPKRNLSIKFPQGKWRRFHFTVEKMKKSSNNENSEGRALQVSIPGKQVVQKGSGAQKKTSSTESLARPSSRSDENAPRVQPLQELLENTAVLYCAATGVHQEDLAQYIDSLDTKQSAQWLEEWNNASA